MGLKRELKVAHAPRSLLGPVDDERLTYNVRITKCAVYLRSGEQRWKGLQLAFQKF